MLSHEKLNPVIGYKIAENKDEAMAACVKQLEFGGAGHTLPATTKMKRY